MAVQPILRKALALTAGAGLSVGSALWALDSSGVVAQTIGFKVGLASQFQDGDAVYKPYVLFDGKRWLLWYNGRKGGTEQIGVASHEGEALGF